MHDPLTLKVCNTLCVTWSKSARNLSKIKQSPAKLMIILRFFPHVMPRCGLDLWPLDRELLQHFECLAFKLSTKFEWNRIIHGWFSNASQCCVCFCVTIVHKPLDSHAETWNKARVVDDTSTLRIVASSHRLSWEISRISSLVLGIVSAIGSVRWRLDRQMVSTWPVVCTSWPSAQSVDCLERKATGQSAAAVTRTRI